MEFLEKKVVTLVKVDNTLSTTLT